MLGYQTRFPSQFRSLINTWEELKKAEDKVLDVLNKNENIKTQFQNWVTQNPHQAYGLHRFAPGKPLEQAIAYGPPEHNTSIPALPKITTQASKETAVEKFTQEFREKIRELERLQRTLPTLQQYPKPQTIIHQKPPLLTPPPTNGHPKHDYHSYNIRRTPNHTTSNRPIQNNGHHPHLAKSQNQIQRHCQA